MIGDISLADNIYLITGYTGLEIEQPKAIKAP